MTLTPNAQDILKQHQAKKAEAEAKRLEEAKRKLQQQKDETAKKALTSLHTLCDSFLQAMELCNKQSIKANADRKNQGNLDALLFIGGMVTTGITVVATGGAAIPLLGCAAGGVGHAAKSSMSNQAIDSRRATNTHIVQTQRINFKAQSYMLLKSAFDACSYNRILSILNSLPVPVGPAKSFTDKLVYVFQAEGKSGLDRLINTRCNLAL